MEIKPIPTTFRKLCTSQFLKIPQFQRPYSWTLEHIEELWSDLMRALGDDYFVGSIVLYNDSKDPVAVYITDGQQRLTTLIILLCALRDVADELELESVGNGIHSIIERVDEDDKMRFVLKYDSGNKYFPQEILSRKRDGRKSVTDEEKTQNRAYRFLKQKVVSYLAKEIGEEWKEDELRDKTKSLLVKLRKEVLGIEFISLTLTNEDDAYIVFETLNSRGMDLEVSHLLKNLLIRLLKPTNKNKDISPVNDTWNRIQSLFESLSSKVNFDTFLLHYWISKEEYVSKKNLFKMMKAKISKSNAKKYLKDIDIAASAYAVIASPSDEDFSNQEKALQSSLEAVNRFGVMQARPLLLSIMRAHYEDSFIKTKQVKSALQCIENFAFQFNAITQSRGGGGISSMYSKLARECYGVKTSQDFADFITSTKTKFNDRDVSQAEFELAFSSLKYSNVEPRDRLLIRYILTKFHQKYADIKVADYSLFTIEHLNPQAGTLDHEDFANIGNLLFIPGELNNKLKDKPFSKKKADLLKSENDFGILSDWKGKSAEEIAERSSKLAKLAFEKVWKI